MKRSLVLSLSLIVVASCSAKQPEVMCTASRSDFAVKYTMVDGDPACVAGLTKMNMAGDTSMGETLGVQSYVADPRKPGDGRTSMAIKSEMGPFALGKFTTLFPDDNEICTVSDLPASDESAMPRYAWKNVRVMVNAAQVGVQFGGDLTYTADNCAATLKAVAISPAVSCDDGTGNPNGDACNSAVDPASGFAGSGIAPDIAVECDKVLLLCVAKKPFPSQN